MEQARRWLFILAVIVTMVGAACGGKAGPAPEEVGPADEPSEAQVVTGRAAVESVEVTIKESFPVQVSVTAHGSLRDGCTEVARVEQMAYGRNIMIGLFTQRLADAACTEAVVPFEEVIPVDVAGLSAGTYNVIVNSVGVTFTLEVDNVAPRPGVRKPENCPDASEGTTVFLNKEHGYCLLFPAGFAVDTPQPATVVISAPPDEETSGVRTSLSITSEPGDGQTVQDVVAALAGQYPDLELVTTETAIGGEQAVVVENLPGRTGNRQAFVVYADVLYTLVAQPVDEALPEATEVAEQIWSVVTGSLAFVQGSVEGAGEPPPPAAGALVDERFDDLGIRIRRPEDWTVERLPAAYALVPADVALPGGSYMLSFGLIEDVPTDDLDAVVEAMTARFEEQGESGFTFGVAFLYGVDSAMVYGLRDACIEAIIPGDGFVRTITVGPDACDASGALNNQVVSDILNSVELFEPAGY